MDPLTLAALVAIGYYLYTRGQAPARTTAGAPSGYAVAGPGGTAINLPGIGSYQNLPGQGVQLTLDPKWLGSLLTPQPAPAPYEQPVQVVGADQLGYPVYTEPDPYTSTIETAPDAFFSADGGAGDFCSQYPELCA